MSTKFEYKTNKLIASMKEKTNWNLARVKFLVAFITTVCKLQTVNFTKLAQGLGGTALFESNLRKIQRFFSEFLIDKDMTGIGTSTVPAIFDSYMLSYPGSHAGIGLPVNKSSLRAEGHLFPAFNFRLVQAWRLI